MNFGLEEEGGSLIAPMELAHPRTSSPSHSQQVEEQAPKPVGWTMCFLLMTLGPVQKLCVNDIYICMPIPYMSSVIGRVYIYIYIYTAVPL